MLWKNYVKVVYYNKYFYIVNEDYPMKLLNEMVSDWEIAEIAEEMDAVLEEYRLLLVFTQINEGVLDNLSDDFMQKVTELQFRIDAVAKARKIVSQLQKSGGFSKEEAAKHRKKITDNKKALMAALKRTSNSMKKIQKTAKTEIKKATAKKDPVSTDDVSAQPASPEYDGEDLETYGRLAPFILNKATKGELTTDIMMGDRYSDVFDLLAQDGLVTQDGQITPKGTAALEATRAKRGKAAPRQSPSAIDDLASLGGDDDEGGDELSFG